MADMRPSLIPRAPYDFLSSCPAWIKLWQMLISTVLMIYEGSVIKIYKVAGLLLDGHERKLFVEVGIVRDHALKLLAIDLIDVASHLDLQHITAIIKDIIIVLVLRLYDLIFLL